ncbi:MAG TPA: DNA polymerase III subunit delta [Desulfonatronum sp.]|nr:DNA polymerase III subunit delta [Desulfonatronum sp.]
MRPPFFFCVCPDVWLIQERIRELTTASGCGEWTRQTFWADEPLDASFWTALTMTGLLSVLGAGRILVIRRAHQLPVKTLGDMEPLLRTAKPDLWVFFCLEGEWKGNTPAVPATISKQPYFKAAKSRGWLWQSPGYSERTLKDFVRQWAKKRKIGFAPGVEAALVDVLPLDGARMRGELDKLELLLGERRRVAAEDLGLLGGERVMNSFAFLKAVLTSSMDLTAWRTVFADQASTGSGMLMPFLGLLQREVRILWQLSAGEEHKVSLPPAIKHEKKRLALELGEKGLTRIGDLVFAAEHDLKTGRRKADQIMEFLVANLARR